MNPQYEEFRTLLDPFLRALEDPAEYRENSLFEGRDALKAVFDRIDQKGNRPLAEGFWSVQFLIGALIRKGTVDQSVALEAVKGLLNSLLGTMEQGASEEQFKVDIPGTQVPEPSGTALRLGQGGGEMGAGKSIPIIGSTGAPEQPTSQGPMFGPHSLGQILLKSGSISQDQLNRALELQVINGRRIGDVLSAMGVITIQSLESALSRQGNLIKSEDTATDDRIPPSLGHSR